MLNNPFAFYDVIENSLFILSNISIFCQSLKAPQNTDFSPYVYFLF